MPERNVFSGVNVPPHVRDLVRELLGPTTTAREVGPVWIVESTDVPTAIGRLVFGLMHPYDAANVNRCPVFLSSTEVVDAVARYRASLDALRGFYGIERDERGSDHE